MAGGSAKQLAKNILYFLALSTGLVIMLAVALDRDKPPSYISNEDMSTIVTTARLLRNFDGLHNDLTDETISYTLVQLGYEGCRDQQYYEEVEACRAGITTYEIELVRKAMSNPNAFETRLRRQ